MLNLRAPSHTPRRQAGDTIVEVIIVLAVLGLAIGIAYATANRSLLATRQAEENTQATEILHAQIEALRSYSTSPVGTTNYIYRSDVPFCISVASQQLEAFIHGTPASVTANNTFTGDYANYPVDNGCLYNSLFHIAIAYTQNDPITGNQIDTFTARATWDDVEGAGQDTATLVYRLHP